ncbi:General transcription factor IIE subunit 2 [Sarcoptes scabiei]|uniref:Transcription initiation factor IIE subunit beta n=1 Tax=Sarcoptes scabiei TaxID=52283 RepID=A0A132A7K6_SARSC|nr:General transcription factor IIE subunit 2 [Sarcoptes scabiei]KPM06907.1 transcription initiation factor IIE subunit beta-like protein [Sarcoptes scabiei]UXI16974.1 beclin 1-associated autophagy-related key regulator [Sarcoptes scabiei]
MDPKLLKERESFMKRAFALPVVEKRKEITPEFDRKSSSRNNHESGGQATKKKRYDFNNSGSKSNDFSMFDSKPSVPVHNFSILTKIVNSMKDRYLNGDSEALTFDELLDETNQLDLNSRQKQWLLTEALLNNPRIRATEDSKYAYKPIFNLRDKKSLLRLLEKYDSRGLGAVSYEDVKESLPNAERIIKHLADRNQLILITRPVDKKKILFINNMSLNFSVDEEFQKSWRSIAVEGMDESKIEEYLKSHGISSMQDLNLRKSTLPIQKRKEKKKRQNFKKLNNHLDGLLEDYSDKQP